MFDFSRKIVCSIEAVLLIALAGEGSPVRSRTITRRQNIPDRYLEQPLQRLVHCGILRGVRGPRGGYVLARPAEHIRLDEIVSSVRGLDGGPERAALASLSPLGDDVVRPLFERLDEEVLAELSRISIADLVRQVQDRSAPAAPRRHGLVLA
ncbi:MAG: Rrf2 family transcriptional regulator [Alphaproteobacteria bacterium]|nr:MAG: Rrf2 family transcriptional regulator [Alphaproteobacteria bacterium]